MDQTNKPAPDFFNEQAAQSYDERNSKLSRISDCMHFLTTLVLKQMPTRSRVLCVGVGTGAEIFSLAKEFPEWTFVGVEPSLNMLNVCKERLKAAGLDHRVELINGYVQDVPLKEPFDAALAILVGHFVKREEKLNFFQHMTKQLKSGGYLVDAEISFDLDSAEFPSILKGWEQVQLLMGGTPESIANIPTQLKQFLSVLPPAENENIIRQSGIKLPVKFFQAFMISAWYGKKD